jgi:hypothetical protein
MAYSQADLDALDAEIAKVRVVSQHSFSDQSITFRPLAELYAERARIAQLIASSAGQSRTRYAATRKGV